MDRRAVDGIRQGAKIGELVSFNFCFSFLIPSSTPDLLFFPPPSHRYWQVNVVTAIEEGAPQSGPSRRRWDGEAHFKIA